MVANPAKDSHEIQRLRNRLKKHLVDQDENYTVKALVHNSELIKKQLLRSKDSLAEKTINLFDQNRHPAKEKPSTSKIREIIKENYFQKGLSSDK